jgi:hypothetical protein
MVLGELVILPHIQEVHRLSPVQLGFDVDYGALLDLLFGPLHHLQKPRIMFH